MGIPTVVLLGYGMQGRAVVHDLLQQTAARIIVADNRPGFAESLPVATGRIVTRHLNAVDEEALAELLAEGQVVVETLAPGLGFSVLRLAADVGVPLVNSMYRINPALRDPLERQMREEELQRVDEAARRRGIPMLTEFGLDPGLDLVSAARIVRELDSVEEFYSYGAGLPVPEAADNPLKYKFSWSVLGVMRSYTRPARVISRGRVLDIPGGMQFDEPYMHHLDVPEAGGTMECYPNGDSVHYADMFGLRDSVREMARYTGRWPGHCAFWRIMVRCGFLSDRPLALDGGEVTPLQVSAALLSSQDQFRYQPDEADLSLVRNDIRGRRAGKRARIVEQLLDFRDPASGLTSMQRTVGFTLALGARLVLEGKLPAGLLSPLDVPHALVVEGLERHGIRFTRQEMEWDESGSAVGGRS